HTRCLSDWSSDVCSSDLDVLPALVRHFGEPFGDDAALAVWMLARETCKHVTVVLTGDGGDEGFAGYDWYRTALRLTRWRSVAPKIGRASWREGGYGMGAA